MGGLRNAAGRGCCPVGLRQQAASGVVLSWCRALAFAAEATVMTVRMLLCVLAAADSQLPARCLPLVPLLHRHPPGAQALPAAQVRARGALLGRRLPAGAARCALLGVGRCAVPMCCPSQLPTAASCGPTVSHFVLLPPALLLPLPPAPGPVQAIRTRSTSLWPPKTRRCSVGAWRCREAPCCLPRSTACTWRHPQPCRSSRRSRWGVAVCSRGVLSRCRCCFAAF